MARTRTYTPRYAGYRLRYWWFRLRNPHIATSGLIFIDRGAEIRCARGLGHMELGRLIWVGRGTALRCHEGFMRIGEKTVFGRDNAANCYLDLEIGAESIFGDRIHVTDFDHRFEDPDLPIRKQGIVKSPVRIGRDCWIGEKATILRGSSVGDGSIVGAHALVRGRFPEGSVIVGNPARAIKRRGR